MEVEDVSDFFELANANLGASPKSLREVRNCAAAMGISILVCVEES